MRLPLDDVVVIEGHCFDSLWRHRIEYFDATPLDLRLLDDVDPLVCPRYHLRCRQRGRHHAA